MLVTTLARQGICISSITYMEVLEGLESYPSPPFVFQRLERLVEAVPVLPFDQAEAIVAVQIRRTLRSQGRRIRSRYLDLLIAATAIEHGLTFVTNNPADFRDIPDLQLFATDLTG